MTTTKRAIAIVSGGLDSVTLAHDLKRQGYGLHLLSFDYGQRHRKELEFAEKCAHRLGGKWDRVDLSGLAGLLRSALTREYLPIPKGHYTDPTMAMTVVPNRNAIMLSIAWGVAVSEQATLVATGVHTGDHAIYPDCRPEFIKAFDRMACKATEGYAPKDLAVWAPYVQMTKADIVRRGAVLGVPFAETWSCYEGGEVHCGACGTCVERREAFALAGVTDPTIYRETSS